MLKLAIYLVDISLSTDASYCHDLGHNEEDHKTRNLQNQCCMYPRML